MKEAIFVQTSCIILSAGSSTRIGMHKALLRYDAEKTFIEKITETFNLAGIEQVIVVVNSELFKLISESSLALSRKVKLLVNDKPELGRFYSLQTGVKLITTGNYCFFQNIDNPFTSQAMLRELILHKNEAEVIMLTFKDKAGHPVLFNPLVAQKIRSEKNNDLRIDHFLRKFKIKYIESLDNNILININTLKQYHSEGFI